VGIESLSSKFQPNNNNQMTSYAKKDKRPEIGRFYGFHHVELWVSNAKQIADYYCIRFGYTKVGYKGLETGSRRWASHVVSQNNIRIVFTSALNPLTEKSPEDEKLYHAWIAQRGDSVRNIAFKCDDAGAIYKKATSRGAKGVFEPEELKDDNGAVTTATIETYGGVYHTLVSGWDTYKGSFLPGFKEVTEQDPVCALLPDCHLDFIDHIVGNHEDGKMEEVSTWYEKMLDFHRFWSVDDKQVHTEYSSLRSVVMTDYDETIKMPNNEPAKGKRKSQIQEYVEYHGGAGVQHIAINVKNILVTLPALKKRGMKFLTIPKSYYKNLRKRLDNAGIKVKEDLDTIEKHNILVDFDDKGYLLQIFTKPVEDRPTLFYEIIQRAGNSGFGVGNFKALFQSIEQDQAARGNLTVTEGDDDKK